MKNKKHLLQILVVIILFSCETFDREIESEHLVGKWVLIKKTSDGVNIMLDNCSSKTTIVFKSNKTYLENIVYIDSLEGCKSYEEFGKWDKFNGVYDIDNLSIIDQKLKIQIINNELVYSYQSWHDPFGNFTTTDIKRCYQKKE